jgi:hypothetical protein
MKQEKNMIEKSGLFLLIFCAKRTIMEQWDEMFVYLD